MLSERKKYILKTIIKEHIKTGAPVGSGFIVDKYKLDISPATVRNEMAELEDGDYIMQPHTSAGRVPTEKAYEFYLDNIKPKKPSENEIKIFNELLQEPDHQNLKRAAKELAKTSGQAVFWALERNNLYYTGISNLLHQPEFSYFNNIYAISTIIDKIDEIIDKIYDQFRPGTHILIGSNNPFSSFCGTIISKYKGSKNGMFGILGPLRMNYEKNLSLAEYINKKLTV